MKIEHDLSRDIDFRRGLHPAFPARSGRTWIAFNNTLRSAKAPYQMR